MALEATVIKPASPHARVAAHKTSKRIRAKERMFLVERLALLLETGTPLLDSLTLLRQQNRNADLEAILGSLEREVKTGVSFSDALRIQREAFPESYATLVGAAERGGFLPEVLERLHRLEEHREELRSTLVAALSYPAFLMVFSTAVVIFVLVVVFPKFEALFTSIADQLPVTTRWFLGISHLLRDWWWVVIAGAAGAGFLLFRWYQKSGRDTLDRWAYGVPILRNFAAELHLIQFLRVVSLSLANGVSLMEALGAARVTLGSPRFRRFVADVEQGVSEGRGLAQSFRSFTALPPLAGQMIATGEETGNLARVMERVADFYERQWRKRLQTATKLAEPLMLLVIGGVIGLIVGSLLLPIFKLSRVAG